MAGWEWGWGWGVLLLLFFCLAIAAFVIALVLLLRHKRHSHDNTCNTSQCGSHHSEHKSSGCSKEFHASQAPVSSVSITASDVLTSAITPSPATIEARLSDNPIVSVPPRPPSESVQSTTSSAPSKSASSLGQAIRDRFSTSRKTSQPSTPRRPRPDNRPITQALPKSTTDSLSSTTSTASASTAGMAESPPLQQQTILTSSVTEGPIALEPVAVSPAVDVTNATVVQISDVKDAVANSTVSELPLDPRHRQQLIKTCRLNAQKALRTCYGDHIQPPRLPAQATAEERTAYQLALQTREQCLVSYQTSISACHK
jgi:hypothetical protein